MMEMPLSSFYDSQLGNSYLLISSDASHKSLTQLFPGQAFLEAVAKRLMIKTTPKKKIHSTLPYPLFVAVRPGLVWAAWMSIRAYGSARRKDQWIMITLAKLRHFS